MKIATQTSAELTHVAKLIENIPIAMLTTLEDDGALASRPMTALEMDAQGALWFFTDVQSSKVGRLRAVNPGLLRATRRKLSRPCQAAPQAR